MCGVPLMILAAPLSRPAGWGVARQGFQLHPARTFWRAFDGKREARKKEGRCTAMKASRPQWPPFMDPPSKLLILFLVLSLLLSFFPSISSLLQSWGGPSQRSQRRKEFMDKHPHIHSSALGELGVGSLFSIFLLLLFFVRRQ